MIRKLVFLLAIVALVAGVTIVSQAQPQTPVTRHTRDEVVSARVPMVGRLSANKTMDITFILQHSNQAELDQLLNDLYDPTSPSYRHFLTVEQFTEKFGPSREDYETVKSFAREHGFQILSTSRNRMNLRVRGTVANIEKALNVTMGVYQHPTENRTFFGPDREPSPDMSVQLWAIGSLDTYSTPKPMYTRRDLNGAQPDGVISDATTGSCPSQSFCGSDMRAAYYGGTALNGSGQSLGLFEFIGTDLVDLTTYYTNAGQVNNVPVTLKSVDTQSTLCKEPTCDDTEQTLDMTQALGMAPNMSSLVMWIGTGALSGQTLDDPGILNGMATASPLNAQLSCSWAWTPPDPTTDNVYFQQFAAQGQNFFAASGDSGNWANASFVWPADDVFITSVGGTDLKTASAGGPWSSETGWVDGGGGITKNGFAIPSWQVTAAAGCAKCSKTLRNGPDISANADFTFYVCADQTACTANNFGGTSFAAPMWAGFLALVNQQALLNGNPVLGFVNPALYAAYSSSSYNSDFHDILTGGNTLGATVGYDLATGIGSPQAALIAVLAGTSTSGFSLSANPTGVSVVQGNSGTSTITSTTTGGFNTPVVLSASGQPTGVTVTFSPTSITGTGTSTMTMAVAGTVATGVYPITVKGTAGSTVETTTVTLTVTSSSGFSLSANPTSVSVKQGKSGTSTITSTTTGGFNTPVVLSASGQPTGVTVTFNPTSITGTGTSTMTMAVASTTATGTYTITVKGTAGSTTETTTVTLTVTSSGGGSFTLAAKPTKASVAPGGHTNAKITATPSGGFTGTIALTASGQPTGVQVNFKPTSITGGSGTAAMQINVSRTAKAGTFTITIKGTSGSTTATTTFTLTIT